MTNERPPRLPMRKVRVSKASACVPRAPSARNGRSSVDEPRGTGCQVVSGTDLVVGTSTPAPNHVHQVPDRQRGSNPDHEPRAQLVCLDSGSNSRAWGCDMFSAGGGDDEAVYLCCARRPRPSGEMKQGRFVFLNPGLAWCSQGLGPRGGCPPEAWFCSHRRNSRSRRSSCRCRVRGAEKTGVLKSTSSPLFH